MAKLGSSSCRALVQGMMLLALLLLASIQAEAGVQGVVLDMAEEYGQKVKGLFVDGHEKSVTKTLDQGAKTFVTRFCPSGRERVCKGVKTGLRVHRYLCRAQGRMDKFVDILGGDLLSKSFPTLYYHSVPCRWSADQPQVQAAGTTPLLRITGIRVGLVDIPVHPPASYQLSTTQPAAYTEQEIRGYGVSLTNAVNRQMNPPNPPVLSNGDKLCYLVPESSLPRISLVLTSDNGVGGVMQTTELSVDATSTVWYPEPFIVGDRNLARQCLGIRSTVELVLGRL